MKATTMTINGIKLTDKQTDVLNRISNEPQTAAELGAAAATLTSLVNKNLIKRVGSKSPFKYVAIEDNNIAAKNAGDVVMKTSDGQRFVVNMYLDRFMGKTIGWNDLNGNPHSGVCLKYGEDSFFVRTSKEVLEIKFTDTVVVRFCGKGMKTEQFYKGIDY